MTALLRSFLIFLFFKANNNLIEAFAINDYPNRGSYVSTIKTNL